MPRSCSPNSCTTFLIARGFACNGDLWGAIYGTPELLRGFMQSMTGLTLATARAIAQRFPWARYRSFIALGTAQGAFLVHEPLIDADRRQHVFDLLMSLTMLIDTHGGFDFTGAECTTWMRQAGFRETRIEPLVGHEVLVVGIK